jgi:hypothetical protein
VTAPVDVLAVMDRQIGSLRRAGVAEVGDFAEIVAARAAVAELIEEATHVDALSIQSVAHGRLRAALARVQGGAK